jgi:hypothetical protein
MERTREVVKGASHDLLLQSSIELQRECDANPHVHISKSHNTYPLSFFFFFSPSPILLVLSRWLLVLHESRPHPKIQKSFF